MNRAALGVCECKVSHQQRLDLGGEPIGWRVVIIGMRDGMLNDSTQDQQSATDAAACPQGKDQQQKKNGFPA